MCTVSVMCVRSLVSLTYFYIICILYYTIYTHNDSTRRRPLYPTARVSPPVLLLLDANEAVVAFALALVYEVEPLADLVH